MTMATKKAQAKKAPAKKVAAKKTAGRPSIFSQEIADRICELLADKYSLRQICTRDDMPNRATVHRWMAEKPDFATKCVHAREEQADYIVEDCIDIEDRTIAGEINPAAARAVLASKQWRASKLAPKKYGDKLALGQDESLGPITVVVKSYSESTKSAK